MTSPNQSASAAGERLTVKPLEWTRGEDVNCELHAGSLLGTYTIRKKQGSLGYWLTLVGGYHATVDAAKAAAEAHYRKRILSALSPSLEGKPAPVQEGWVLVPREPTEAMLQAADKAWRASVSATSKLMLREAVRAMLAAAPPAPERKEVEELRAALKPFAAIASRIPGGMHDCTKVKVTAREPLGRSDSTLVLATDGLTVEDFHRAAALTEVE